MLSAMSSTKVGRNDPCPCGSGKKFKYCCSLQSRTQGAGDAPDTLAEFREAMAGQQFATLADVQTFAGHFMRQRNQAPDPDFHGLSPEHMFHFLHHAFDSPRLVRFAERLEVTPAAPVMTLFEHIAAAIGAEGLKATAKGNLPRDVCRSAALATLGEEGYRKQTRHVGINGEDDYYDLHVTRLLGEVAGLIRKQKGRFTLSRECRSLIDKAGAVAIYPRLLRAFTQKFNWGYGDLYPELFLIQQSFVFTLYLLTRYGEEARTQDFYADNFIRAYPMLLDEITQNPYASAEDDIKRCYSLRALERFAVLFGLIKRDVVGTGIARQHYITKLPLLEAVVRFQSGV